MPESEVEVPAPQGAPLRGTWRTPDGAGPFPCVAFIHGLTLDRSFFEGTALAFAAAGVASLRVDLRGHGSSPGALREQGFHDQVADVAAAYAGLAGLPGADASRRGLLGFSMGGAMAALLSLGTPVKALALWSPLLKTGLWKDLRHSQYGPPRDGFQPIWDGILVSERLFSEALGQDPFAAALAYAGPLLVCHGGKDRNHPQEASLELAAARGAAARPVASWFPPSSGHRWHVDQDRRIRDALGAAFFQASL